MWKPDTCVEMRLDRLFIESGRLNACFKCLCEKGMTMRIYEKSVPETDTDFPFLKYANNNL